MTASLPAGKLYPTFPVVTVQTRPAVGDVRYRRGYLYDFVRGDIAIDGAGRSVSIDGYQEWAQWVILTVLTERFAYVIYPRDHGAELEALSSMPSRAAAQAHFARTVTEALKQDLRTKDVYGFTFSWGGDEMRAGFIVEPTIGAKTKVLVRISG